MKDQKLLRSERRILLPLKTVLRLPGILRKKKKIGNVVFPFKKADRKFLRHECFKRIIRIIPTQTQRSRSWFVCNIVETQEPINRLLGPRDWAQYHYCRLTQLARNQTNLWTGGIASKYKSALKSQIQLVRCQEKLKSPNTDAPEERKKNTERKYDEINPSSSLEYVHETFCPLLILDEMGDCTCYTVQKNTDTTDNLAWTNALLNEFCITGFISSTCMNS